MKIPDKVKCEKRQYLVNDFIDRRMSSQQEQEYLQMLEDCKKNYECEKCQEFIRTFEAIKKICSTFNHTVNIHRSVQIEAIKKRLF